MGGNQHLREIHGHRENVNSAPTTPPIGIELRIAGLVSSSRTGYATVPPLYNLSSRNSWIDHPEGVCTIWHYLGSELPWQLDPEGQRLCFTNLWYQPILLPTQMSADMMWVTQASRSHEFLSLVLVQGWVQAHIKQHVDRHSTPRYNLRIYR